jgi:HAD superfamily hydrolase (TIGR01484 family)
MLTFSLACDYDETLASNGRVAPAVLDALLRFKAVGGKSVLVTGRELDDLLEVGPDMTVFDFVVAENGAVLYRPESGEIQSLAGPPSNLFVARLRQRGVQPVSVGRSIVATGQRHTGIVHQTIVEMELDLDIILNRSSLMVLPHGVNKGTGLKLALQQMHLAAENVVGVGDAENDDAFLTMCGVYVAVANAIPSIKNAADWVTDQESGAGVVEVINRVISGDLCATRTSPSR